MGGGCWPEERLESNISGQAKAPIQAEERIWPREKSPASHSILCFSWQPLCRHPRWRPAACRACSLHPVEAQGMPSCSCHDTPGHSLFWKTLGEACRKHAEDIIASSGVILSTSTSARQHVSQTIISEAQSLPARSSGEFCSSVDYLTLRRKVLKNNRSKYLLKTVK